MAQSQTTQATTPPAVYIPVVQNVWGKRLRHLWRVGKRNKLGAFGVVIVVFVMGMALLSPWISRYDDNEPFQTVNPEYNPTANPIDIAQNPNLSTPFTLDRFQAPSWDHWFGTDQFGRDIYARIVVGSQLAVIIGIGASIIAVASGTVVGLVSGYLGGWFDTVIQRFVDAIQAFPGLVLLLLLASLLDEPNIPLTVGALGFLGFATSVRIVRASVLSVSQMTYVEAARAYGSTDWRIMAKHVFPNIIASVLVVFSISIGAYILAEASLSFLGLGPGEKTTWGKMVNSGRNAVELHPWESVFAGTFITLAVLGFNLAGDALRDELDPRLRGR
jgi:peptide/nickel transport system permease protein